MLLFSDAVTSAYKDTSKALKEVENSVKVVMEEDDNGNIITSDLKTNE